MTTDPTTGDAFKVEPCPHPSEFIAEELLARGWTMDDLAAAMSIGEPDEERAFCINWLVLDVYHEVGPNRVNCRMGAKTARMLGKAFGTSLDFFLNLEAAWVSSQAIKDRS